MQDEFVEHLQKRLRNLQKRKQRLDGYAEQVKTNPNALNSDQLAALQNKDSVEAPLKELTDVLALYKQSYASREEQQLASIQQASKVAREEAAKKARDQLRTVTQFLFLAAFRHQDETSDRSELEAVDTLLQQLYSGTDEALEAADKLADGKGQKVHGDYTFAQLKEWAVATVNEQTHDKDPSESEPQAGETQTGDNIVAEQATTTTAKPDAAQEAKQEVKPESKKPQNSAKENRSGSPTNKSKSNDSNSTRREQKPGAKNDRQDQNRSQKPGASAGNGDKKTGQNRRRKPQGSQNQAQNQNQAQKQTAKAT